MAIVSVDEMLGVRTCSIDAQWRRTYRRAWRVVTDGPTNGPYAVRLSLPVALGNVYSTGYEFDNFAFCLKLDVAIDGEADDDCQWICTAEYGPYDPTQFPENPLNHPMKISFGGNRFEKAADIDTDGNGIVNSAGDFFDPPPTADDSRPTIRIVRNEQGYNPQYATLWKDTINTDSFFGFDPKTVKMSMPTGELEYSPVCGFYFVVTYEFEVNPEGWEKQVLDQGLRVLSGSGQAQAVDENSQPVTSPVLLDGSGLQLTTGDDPVFLTFKVYKEATFGALGLNPSLAPGIA